jgi:molybdopterin-containing oxidoreductase family iron-sulfur binding subunit
VTDQSPIPNPQSPSFWRTLDERLGDPSFQDHLANEFPSLLPTIEQVADPVARRTFLKLMGASLALAGAAACTRQPAERIVPYVRQPEELIPGRPLFYATAMAIGGVATGLLVESHEGRPTKVEGNPLHPGSLGATDVFAQAAILGLYDPDRAQTLTSVGEIRPWSAFLGAMSAVLTAQQPLRGAGIRILTESVSSPTLAAQIREILSRFPSAKWHQWDPASRDNARAGAKLAFGEFVDAQYRFDQADVILSLDADFLGGGPGALRHAKEFAARRRPEQAERMNRLYAIESMPSSTGARADHRLPARPSEIGALAFRLAGALGRSSGSAGSDRAERFIAAVANDLQAHRGRSLVIAGDGQPAAVHALAHAMNQTLGNAGQTVVYTQCAEAEPVVQIDSLKDLVADLNRGSVDLLIILGGNPVYTAPADLNFADALGKAQLRAHLSLHEDETSALCHWQIPEAHFLEAWSDARGFDGTVSIVQPLIAPLYGGKSAHEVLAALGDRPEKSAHDRIREFWKADKDERTWRRWLHDGIVPDTAFAPKNVSASSQPPAASSHQPPAASHQPPAAAVWRSTSATTRPSSTAASRTTAGCRSSPSRLRASPGTTRCSPVPRPRPNCAPPNRRRSPAASTARSSPTSSS